MANCSFYEHIERIPPSEKMDPSVYWPNYTQLFNFEEEFDEHGNRKWMQENWHIVFYIIAAYLTFIYFGPKLMRNRQPFLLQRELIVWNIAVAAFSIMGTRRAATELIHVLKDFGFTFSVCSFSHVEVERAMGLWTWLFVLSKMAELTDTVFIVLRKKNLMFLHWYHHSIALFFCFYAYKEHTSAGRWFIAMNFLAHSFMYSYLALKSLGMKFPVCISMSVIALEIFQMITFCVVCTWAYLVKLLGGYCHISDRILFCSVILSASYFIVVCKYFYEAYIASSLNQGKKIKKL